MEARATITKPHRYVKGNVEMYKYCRLSVLIVTWVLCIIFATEGSAAKCRRSKRRCLSVHVPHVSAPCDMVSPVGNLGHEPETGRTLRDQIQKPSLPRAFESSEVVGVIVLANEKENNAKTPAQPRPGKKPDEAVGIPGIFVFAIPNKEDSIKIAPSELDDSLLIKLTKGGLEPSKAVAHSGQPIEVRNSEDVDVWLTVRQPRGSESEIPLPAHSTIRIPSFTQSFLPLELLIVGTNITAEIVIDGNRFRAARTDSRGQFTITGLSPGPWRLMLWHRGHIRTLANALPPSNFRNGYFYIQVARGTISIPTIRIGKEDLRK